MKKLLTIISILLLFAGISSAQYGYIPEKISGIQRYTDLTNPSNYIVKGTGPTQLGGSDFDLNGNLYAIEEGTGNFYQIDTATASGTLIATITPTGSEFWSGMACDPTDGTMYICSTDGNSNSFYTIDVTTGATALVGTNTVDDGVVGISFDDSGQMYAIYLVRKFYMIDKTDATPTLVGSMNTACTALAHHGLDFAPSTQTMYMISYNAFTFDTELWTIDISNGSNTLVGSYGIWAGTIAVEPSFQIGFTADNTSVCEGDVVNYTDQSTGATSWLWTFEGGTPATSTQQNPSVTYNTAGVYDVILEVSNGNTILYDTAYDYISVEVVPVQAATPSGPTETCGGNSYDYTTSNIANATSYEWMVEPTDAGTISGTGTTGTFDAADDWSGSYTVKVRASNTCGDGIWSSTLGATLNISPTAFFLLGGGSYCEGGEGLEITLDGSETGVDYELFLDGVSTGNIMAGTGSAISFGLQTDEGSYSAIGSNADCTSDMYGQPFINVLSMPGTPGTPVGPDNVCAGDSETYTTTESSDADTLIWSINPPEAGVIANISGDMLSADIDWSLDFIGSANVEVYGQNDCGDGEIAVLEVSINEAPAPEISGLAMVCEDDMADYSTADNTGSTYEWTVSGGTIVSGAGTHMITVQWGAPGTGYVQVTEDNGNCSTTTDEYTVVIDECTSIEERFGEQISVYPNPAKDFITINLPGEAEINVRVVNMVGQVMMDLGQISRSNTDLLINISTLTEGIYFLQISDEFANSAIIKIIKSH